MDLISSNVGNIKFNVIDSGNAGTKPEYCPYASSSSTNRYCYLVVVYHSRPYEWSMSF